jgi:hypothetical protein
MVHIFLNDLFVITLHAYDTFAYFCTIRDWNRKNMTLGCNQLVEESIPGLSDQDSAGDLYPQAAVDNQEGIKPLAELELPPIFCVRILVVAQ